MRIQKAAQDIRLRLIGLIERSKKDLARLDHYHDQFHSLIASELPLTNVNPLKNRFTDDPASKKLWQLSNYQSVLFESQKTEDYRNRVIWDISVRFGRRNITEAEYNYLSNTSVKKIVKDINTGQYKFGDVR